MEMEMEKDEGVWVRETKVEELMGREGENKKRRLVEVPYTASLGDTLNSLMANEVGAVAVAAPPGHWIGAGGSMILESDKHTGAIRKHYIGMVTMLDVVVHIAGATPLGWEDRMSIPVSSVIGHTLEGLTLWTINPNTSILDCMEVFSKGIHRALVPVDSQMQNISGIELAESSSCYRMLTQMDVLRFLRSNAAQLKSVMDRSVGEVGACTEDVFAVSSRIKVIEVLQCMRSGSLNAVPIVEPLDAKDEDHAQLLNGKGRKLMGTFSATDLRAGPVSVLESSLHLPVVEFKQKTSSTDLVTCFMDSLLSGVVDKAVDAHVHRVWVVDQQGFLQGVVSLTDMLRVVRSSFSSSPTDLLESGKLRTCKLEEQT